MSINLVDSDFLFAGMRRGGPSWALYALKLAVYVLKLVIFGLKLGVFAVKLGLKFLLKFGWKPGFKIQF